MATIFVYQFYCNYITSFINFCLTGQPNDEKKKEDGLEIYIVPQDSSNTKYTGSCLL